MRTTQDGRAQPNLGRRGFLKTGAAAAAIVVTGAAIIHSGEAWGLETKSLAPQTMRALVIIARDIFPHDRLEDKYYAIAMKSWDEKSASDAATKAMIEGGIATLDALAKSAHGVTYAEVAWEVDRVALLRQIDHGAFFGAVQGGMLAGLYNQQDVWPLFGYQGESASKGGYIHRGFNDIEWL